MAFRWRDFRKGSLAYAFLGVLLIYAGWGYVESLSWRERALTFKDQLGGLIEFAGIALTAFGIGNLFRRKGDYDDFEDSGVGKCEDEPRQGSGDDK